ncbi:MAG TPA: FkbM family methyltransferase [Pantanalinema sp.]
MTSNPLHLAKQGLRDLNRRYLDGWAAKSYSQEGEDMILRRFFADRRSGFYVDVGAHHPKRFSNTYYFYKRGWSGINIDAMPGSMRPFEQLRPRDINLEAAIAREPKDLTFYIFNEPALNSLDEALARSRESEAFRIVAEQKLRTRPLAELLAEHVPPGKTIDFLSVDVEGYDLEVLQSNDWRRFRPTFILIECLGLNLHAMSDQETVRFLTDQGYEMVAKTLNTVFFRALEPAPDTHPRKEA